MNPRGFSIRFAGADGNNYACPMAWAAAFDTMVGNNGFDAAFAQLVWVAGVWTMTLGDDAGTTDTWTAPSADNTVVPTANIDWTPTSANGTVLTDFYILTP